MGTPFSLTPFSALHEAPEILLSCTVNVPTLGEMTLQLTYTPHKYVVTPLALRHWLNDLKPMHEQETWESFLTALMDTFYDALLPRSVSIDAEITHPHSAMLQHVHLHRTHPT